MTEEQTEKVCCFRVTYESSATIRLGLFRRKIEIPAVGEFCHVVSVADPQAYMADFMKREWCLTGPSINGPWSRITSIQFLKELEVTI